MGTSYGVSGVSYSGLLAVSECTHSPVKVVDSFPPKQASLFSTEMQGVCIPVVIDWEGGEGLEETTGDIISIQGQDTQLRNIFSSKRNPATIIGAYLANQRHIFEMTFSLDI